jgi:hypothetical protein
LIGVGSSPLACINLSDMFPAAYNFL